jgi:hypothetical protein
VAVVNIDDIRAGRMAKIFTQDGDFTVQLATNLYFFASAAVVCIDHISTKGPALPVRLKQENLVETH